MIRPPATSQGRERADHSRRITFDDRSIDVAGIDRESRAATAE
ncbi:hypothetical protein ACWDHW_14125 [Streptomyces melanosporofaciens]